nr:MAG TPA: hypothetical protein [Caudoviricetes sp.]
MTFDEFKKKIAPYMIEGWVAMNKDGTYMWYDEKPKKQTNFF